MLKWAIAKEDRRDARNQCQSSSSNSQQSNSNSSSNNSSPCISTSNSTKSLLRKRRKLSHSSLLGKGGEVELISGTKNRNQSSNNGGCYLKQHHHQPQPRWCINSTKSNSNSNNDNGLGVTHCPSPTDSNTNGDSTNTCKKNNHSHSAKTNTASHKIGNDSHNCIINTSVSLNNNNNNDPSNCGTNADSKSLLYMSLDHLPLAIVKQYERMLQDQEDNGDKNNNNSHNNHRYDAVSDVHDHNEDDDSIPEKQSLSGSGTGSGKAGGRGGKNKNKKCLSFATSTLPSRSLFKSKSIQNQKKIILPLHGLNNNTSAGTSKSLHSATKMVKQTKIVSNNRKTSSASPEQSETTVREGIPVTECRQPQVASATAKVSTTTATISSPSLSPSPSSVSISASVGSGGTEIIRHARSRSLRTSSSFKTKVNEEQNQKNCQANSNSNPSEKLNTNPPFIYSPSDSHKSSTLPRARNQHQSQTQTQTVNNNHKSILSSSHVKQASQSTQTFKSILKNKNPLELNNNNFTTANQNSLTIENLDLASPIRRPFQSLLNVSTQCNPPTPLTRAPTHHHQTNTNEIMKTNQDDEEDEEEEDDDDDDGNEVQVQPVDVDVDIERRDVIRRPALDKFHQAFRYHGLSERVRDETKEQELDFDHDTTDPQFLEKSLTFSFPAVARCAKKLTLKRSELRKLERIRSQTDRLNRFLRKYYHECLPNLPEEEASQCSPEEKSVSILRTHWIEDKKLSRSHSHSQRLGTALDTLDEENLTDLFNSTGATTSSSSVSGSTDSSSGSSTCSSSSSSSDLDWKGYCILNGNGKSHTGSGSGHGHSGNRHNHHSHSSRKSRSRQKRHSRSVLLSNNETTLLPIIQEDSAEVSSASVKSLESRSHSQNEIPDNQPRHNQHHNKDPLPSRMCSTSSSASATLTMTGRDSCPGGDMSNLSRDADDDDDSIAVKRDNMGDVKDHSRDVFSRNAFVTEGAETDSRKLKGSFKMDSNEPFDLPTTPNPTTLPFADENLRTPQLGFTLMTPHPSTSSSLQLTGPGEMRFDVHETVCCTDNQSTSSSGSHSHGYGSGTTNETARTDKSDGDAYGAIGIPSGTGTRAIVSTATHSTSPVNHNEGDRNKENDHHLDDYDQYERYSLPDDGNSFGATISTVISTMTTNANYPSETENETWNSHEYPSGSPCESSDEVQDEDEDQDTNFVEDMENSSTFDASHSHPHPHPHPTHASQRQISPSRLPPTIINKERTEWGKSHQQNDMAYCDDEIPLTMMSSVSTLPTVLHEHGSNEQALVSVNGSAQVTVSVPEKNEDESLDQSERPSGHGTVLSTPIRRLMKTPMKKSTPRKLVRKPPVKSIFSGKGEVLIRTYSNGDYVTLHVVHAKNLQPSYRSSWKLAIKISLLPEAEATFTKSESVDVSRNRTWVKIDQKFSFEIAKSQNLEQKVFLTFWKRLDKKTSFLGWTTLSLSLLSSTWSNISRSRNNNNNNDGYNGKSKQGLDCWFKLRKRKMSAASTSSYTPAAYSCSKMNENSHSQKGQGRTPSKPSPLPLEIETLEEIQTPDTQDEDGQTDSHSHFHHHHHPDEIKSQFPNSSTMDSGVEDCCEPAVVQPSIELDETQGKRVRVKMVKQENMGFGFSVVWVSPPRIERLEKDKTADLAGLRIGDLIIGVNGEDVTTVPNTTIYHNMKTTGSELDLEIWRKNPPAPTPANVVKSNNTQIGSMVMMLMTGTGSGHPPKVTSPNPPNNHQHVANNNNAVNSPRHIKQPSTSSTPLASSTQKPSGGASGNNNASMSHDDNSNHHHQQHNHHNQQQQPQQQQHPPPQQQQQQQQRPPPQQQHQQQIVHNTCTAATATNNLTNNNNASSSTGVNNNNPPFKVQLPPVSILKPPPPAPPCASPRSPLISSHNHLQRNAMMTKKLPAHPQPTLASSSWKIRFNVELLDNEEDSLKQFFICELKFFRKVVAALDRYLIPAQANQLLTPQEIHLIFAHIISVITMTKRILQCVANGASKTGWRLGEILFSTHSDHISEITSAYTSYAKNLGNSSLILGEKMTLQNFARFVLETPVPKGHLDMTSLLFAPLEHLRNLCEICDEIVHHFEHWTEFATSLKDCYANIVVHTDFMEPISHISMKKHPLLSVRDLEKRIVSTTCQPMKVNEKGRKWLFGSRLFRKENDGTWAPVWAFLFTDIIVLTSHMTRDRVFFVKEAPIRLEDVVTLHFNLPRKNENEFRLLFGPDPAQTHYGRFERILPIHRRPKCNQVVLRTTNLQLKAMWKLLLQRQIITLNTRLSKSSSSNFSISEFCEKFPENETTRPASRPHEEKIDEEPEDEPEEAEKTGSINTVVNTASINNNIKNAGRPLASNYNYSFSPNTITSATPAIERKEIKIDPQGKETGSLFKEYSKPSTLAGRDSRKEFNPPGKIVEEVEEEEKHAMERKKSVCKASGDKVIEAAAAAALEVANMTVVTNKSANANGNSIIKHPQSRTILVPDHKQLVQATGMSTDIAEKVSSPARLSNDGIKAESIISKCPSNTPDTVKTSQLVTTKIQLTDSNRESSSGPERLAINNNRSPYPAAKFTSRTIPPNLSNDPIMDSMAQPKFNSAALNSKTTTTSDLFNHKVPPPILDLIETSFATKNAEKQPLKLIDTGLARNANYRTPLNEKFTQKPVEMLASPSEGSPSKSYLNRIKNPIKTNTNSDSNSTVVTNNNNESIHDLNRSTQDSNKCECEVQEKKETDSKNSAPLADRSLRQEPPPSAGSKNANACSLYGANLPQAGQTARETLDSNCNAKVKGGDACSKNLMSSNLNENNNEPGKVQPPTNSKINGVTGATFAASSLTSSNKLEHPKRNPSTAVIGNTTSAAVSSQSQATSSSFSCDNCSVQSQDAATSVASGAVIPNKRSNDEKSAPLNSFTRSPFLPAANELSSPKKLFQGNDRKGEQRDVKLLPNQNDHREKAPIAPVVTSVGDETKRSGGPEKSKSRDALLERMNSDVSLASNKSPTQHRADIPGPKIMTNAILKNRQQEMMAAAVTSTSPTPSVSSSVHSNVPGSPAKEGIITNNIRGTIPGRGKIIPSPLTTTSIGICEHPESPKMNRAKETIPSQTESRNRTINYAENITTYGNEKRNVIAPSQMEIERCKAIGESNNESNSCAKGKVYANSPIVSGFGSERSRRRLLYDLKVRRDYPELFGITPRDRRSFIKQLGEQDVDSDNALVAPYYYHTRLSPLPLLKQLSLKNMSAVVESSPTASGAKAIQQLKQIPQEANKIIGMATTSICNKKGIGEKLHSYLGGGNAKISPAASSVSTSTSTILSKNEFRQRLKLMESLDDDDDDASSSSSRPSVRHNQSNSNSSNGTTHSHSDSGRKAVNSNKEMEEGIGEDSDDDASLDEEGSRVMGLMMNEKSDGVLHHLHSHNHRRRSPEESSSNDSGISEEILIMTDSHCHSKNICASLMTEEVSEDSATASQSATKPNEVISLAHNYAKCAPACVNSATSTNNTDIINTHVPITINSCISASSPPVRPVPALRNYNNHFCIVKSSSDRTIVPVIGVSPNSNNSSNNISNVSVSVSTSTSTSCTSSGEAGTTFVKSDSPDSTNIQKQNHAEPLLMTHVVNTRNQHDPEPQLLTKVNSIESPSTQTDDSGPGTANAMSHDKTSVGKDKTGRYDDSKMSPICLSVEGETKNGMEAVVELASPPQKVTMDKAIGTEDDDYIMDFSWIGRLPEKSYRTLMAERRDAFFHHPHPNSNIYPNPNCHPHTNGFMDYPPFNRHHPHHSYGYFYHHNNYSNSNPSQSQRIKSNSSTITTVTSSSQPSSSSSYSCYLPPSCSNYFNGEAHDLQAPTEPLLVKIYDGDALQSTDSLREKMTESPILKKPCERVMYTRLEQQKTARVERVESSDDSTSSSSDVASASPAAENGTTDPSWSSSSSSLAGYSSSMKEEPSPSTSKCQTQSHSQSQDQSQSQSQLYQPLASSSPSNNSSVPNNSSISTSSACHSNSNGYYSKSKSILMTSSFLDDGSSCSNRSRPEIVVTKDSPETTRKIYTDNSTDDEDDDQATSNNSIVSNGWDKSRSSHSGGGKSEFLRVESNDSTAENYGDDDDYNFDDDDDEDLSHCSVATMNRYGTFESLEKIESEDTVGTMPEFNRNMPRSKARFTFDDDDDDDEEDLFEEDFESDFNFRFPSQIQDNTYSVSRLGPLPPLLEEDYEDDMYDEQRASSGSPSNSTGDKKTQCSSHNQVDQAGVRGDGFLLARIATMYARSSISPLKIFRELLLKKRYRQWSYKE